ncbi:hypothetical protein P175DRAFT_019820 [Aspergillus ochraceoroseus IBT 24754]|uniref:Uncharacterized protein n=1 Tax=Aspergillus ochraceoroseus IBT 24754 TaxID=1392256 RepID=A0A2T5M6D7_9EURO|nr:uncharacterized protein P175DRAFT_019820 [Aspergillus ochraceoroseus IBT 24754]PTU24097.1 hypothetical protein P175DRAFT_019820 [Aspergillus ochraceoroseus IBT 24754]
MHLKPAVLMCLYTKCAYAQTSQSFILGDGCIANPSHRGGQTDRQTDRQTEQSYCNLSHRRLTLASSCVIMANAVVARIPCVAWNHLLDSYCCFLPCLKSNLIGIPDW